MTFTITSEVENAHLTSAHSAGWHIGESCLQDGPVGPVGLEVEAHCFDLADPMRRPGWAELTDAGSPVCPTLPGGSAAHRRARRRCRTVRPSDGRPRRRPSPR